MRKSYNIGKENGNWKGGITSKVYHCKEKGCHNTIHYNNWKYGEGRCQSCAAKYLHEMGVLNSKYSMKGKHHSEQTRRKMNISHGGDGRFKFERLPTCIDCGKELGDYRSKRCKSCNTKEQHRRNAFNYNTTPNKPERQLNKLLNKLLPKQYKFVGDNKIMIDTFNPDFVNCNGQKKIIELYGDYWHKLPEVMKRDKRRKIAYKKYGYKTLIIWENELKNIDKVKNKIIKFNKKRKIENV